VADDSGPAVPADPADPNAPADPAEPPAVVETVAVGFAADVQPILAARCQPCHFAGGKMYAELPFDRAETVREFGTRLFSRIKDPAEQAALRAFLAQTTEPEDEGATSAPPSDPESPAVARTLELPPLN
jgi:hypothetical protein